MFHLQDLEVVYEKEGDVKDGPDEFVNALPSSNARFLLYDHEFSTSDGRKADTLYLFYWTPLNCNQRETIQYTQALPTFRDELPGVVCKTVSTANDITDLIGGGAEESDEDPDDWLKGQIFNLDE